MRDLKQIGFPIDWVNKNLGSRREDSKYTYNNWSSPAKNRKNAQMLQLINTKGNLSPLYKNLQKYDKAISYGNLNMFKKMERKADHKFNDHFKNLSDFNFHLSKHYKCKTPTRGKAKL